MAYAAAMRRILTALGLTSLLLLASFPAYAADFPDPSIDDPAFGDPGMDMGVPGWFGAVFVLVLGFGIAVAIYRVSSARRMASRAGLDPGEAARVTLLSDEGYGATYLASQLRTRDQSSPVTPRSTAERLRELETLRSDRLVTEDEYAARRKAILEGL